MIVIDTHALVWWIHPEKSRLSPAATSMIERALEKNEAVVSSISAWEIGMLVRKGRIEFAVGVSAWFQEIEKTPGLRFLPVDNRIALLSQNLPGELHWDPADRIIVALAQDLGATLVTVDERLREYPHVRTTS